MDVDDPNLCFDVFSGPVAHDQFFFLGGMFVYIHRIVLYVPSMFLHFPTIFHTFLYLRDTGPENTPTHTLLLQLFVR